MPLNSPAPSSSAPAPAAPKAPAPASGLAGSFKVTSPITSPRGAVIDMRGRSASPAPAQMQKLSSAYVFGVKLAMDPRLMGGLGGAALGAGVGGLAGLVNPGVDENGKRKSRLGAALRGALGGGALGGLGGAAAGQFAPNQMLQFGSQVAGLLGGGKAAPSQAEPKYREIPDQPYDDETAEKNYEDAYQHIRGQLGMLRRTLGLPPSKAYD